MAHKKEIFETNIKQFFSLKLQYSSRSVTITDTIRQPLYLFVVMGRYIFTVDIAIDHGLGRGSGKKM
jgi:hypothetical protein